MKTKNILLTAFGIFLMLIFGGGSILIGIRTGFLDIIIGIIFIVAGAFFIPYIHNIIYWKQPKEVRTKKALTMGLLIFILGVGMSFYSSKLLIENPPEIEKKKKHLAVVKSGMFYGLIDENNDFFIQPKFKKIYPVKNAFVGDDKTIITIEENYTTNFNEIYGYIYGNIIVRENNKFGLWNLQANSWLMKPEFEFMSLELPNSLLIKQNGSWRILNIEESFYYHFNQQGDTAFFVNNKIIAVGKNNHYDLIDKDNKVIAQKIDFVPDKQEDRIIFINDSVVFLIDKKQQKNLNLKATKVSNIYSGKFWFGKKDKFYLYDINSKNVIDSTQELLSNINSSICIIRENNKYYYYNVHSAERVEGYVIPGASWEASSLPLIPFKKDNLFGFKDIDNKVVIPPEYGNITTYFYDIE